MGKKKKTGFPEDVRAVYLGDRTAWEAGGICVFGPAPREEVMAEYARLTENGTRQTEQDRRANNYHFLRQVR